MWLAAPTIATLRVVGHYVISRLYDRDPFVDLEEEPELPKPGLIQRAGQAALTQLKDRLDQVTEDETSGTDHESDSEQAPVN
jgi:hypothetical protein